MNHFAWKIEFGSFTALTLIEIKGAKLEVLILRYDVDRLPGNSFVIASIEKEAGIKAGYYFRKLKGQSSKMKDGTRD